MHAAVLSLAAAPAPVSQQRIERVRCRASHGRN